MLIKYPARQKLAEQIVRLKQSGKVVFCYICFEELSCRTEGEASGFRERDSSLRSESALSLPKRRRFEIVPLPHFNLLQTIEQATILL
jgi:hypothetical protein